ncbi:MAG: ArnT family glycosyltransferase [Solirubrobacteraceae bacterium]
MPARLDSLPKQRLTLLALLVVTTAAAGLRFASLRSVPLDPFYDAAVRSMSLSWHNLFFGAFEPGGSVSIDKPPVDLWLQVLSVKLFGFGSAQLKLPQALAGTLAVPLLFDAVRRVFGELAGLLSGLTLALLPIAVLSSRSDTMDSVMMLLSVAALWMLIRFAQEQRKRWLLGAAAAMGIAFNVKLFQALVPLPAFALLAAFAIPPRWPARLRLSALAAFVFVVFALSWLSATLLFPASDRPYAIGSTNGSAWNAAFVFNGYDRIAKPAGAADLSGAPDGPRRAPANNSEVARAQVPIGKPGLLRLWDHDGPLSGLRLGYLLLPALLFGVPALIRSVRWPAGDVPTERPAAIALLLWLATGLVLFSAMARLHPRYVEGFTPAVAAAAGIGLAWASRAQGHRRALFIAGGAIASALYAQYLIGGTVLALTLVACAATIASCLLLRRTAALAAATNTLALALPVQVAIGLVRHSESDAGRVGFMRPSQVTALSDYLRAHQGTARYEFATAAATQAASVIVRDARPVLVLTSFAGQRLVDVARLSRLVSQQQVRYALLGGDCGPHQSSKLPSCSPAAAWVRSHGVDVSRAAGLARARILWRLR